MGALKKSYEKGYKAVGVTDDNIWRFRQQLVSRTTDMLKSGAEPVVKFLFVNRGLFSICDPLIIVMFPDIIVDFCYYFAHHYYIQCMNEFNV